MQTSVRQISSAYGFGRGAHHVAEETRIPKGYARRVDNFNIDDSGVLNARRKFVRLDAGGHSPYAFGGALYFFDCGALYRLVPGGRVPVYAADGPFVMQGEGRVWYVEVNDLLLFSNGHDSGCLGPDGVARPWGATAARWFVGERGADSELLALKLSPFPACVFLARLGGRVYGAAGDVVYCTQALDYASYDPRYDFVILPGPVTALGAVRDGLYISTEQGVFFYRPPIGAGEEGSLTPVAYAPALYGSQVYVPYRTLGVEAIGETQMDDAFCWLTVEGLVAGFAGGRVEALTAAAVRLPPGREARTALVKSEGIYQIVSVLKSPSSAPADSAQDSVFIEL